MRFAVPIAVLVGFVTSAALTAAEPAAGKVFECRFTDAPLKIDGKGDEPVWKSAAVIENFALPWLKEKARAAKTATRARLLWDKEALYFFADMDDADLYADVQEHDGQTWFNDVFELFFKPADDKPGYYEFQINAAGTTLDMFLPERGAGGYQRFKADGEFHWQTAVARRGTLNKWSDVDQGWSVEGRIPWTDMLRTGGRPELGEVWKFALCRYDYSVGLAGQELSTCAPLTTASFHQFEDYALLRFVGSDGKHAARPFGIGQRVPLTTSRVVGSPDPPLPYRTRRAFPQLALNFPIHIQHQPGSDRLIVLAQERSSGPTTMLRIADDPAAREPETLLQVPGKGLAYAVKFHPRFAENGYVYLGWNAALAGETQKKCRITRYTIDRQPPYKLDPASALEIIAWESNGHNGADLCFGPDGMMYVTTGDGTSDSDTNVTGQDLTKPLAKLLRLDVDHPAEGKTYRVPPDNPFVGQDGIVPETWAYGFRNPWRITCDAKTGHIWVGNNGQDLWEQIYFVRKGDNFGWSVYEGSHPFYLQRKLGPHPHTLPAVEHPHSEARSLTGGVVYYGKRLPELRGAYLYGDYSTGRIWGVRHDGQRVTWHKLLADTPFAISCLDTDSHGEVLIADHRGGQEGAFYYLDPTPPGEPTADFPRTLSASGLFASVAGHKLQPGVVPYSVNSPLWSDGAYKERFIAIPDKPGEDMRIEFGGNRGWKFPDEAVLIKSFALEMQAGDPASRRWVETRFMTKQQGEWAGYSYVWNDEQTEATLVADAGLDREFDIRVPKSPEHPTGIRKQTWRIPSRTECMVCHSRAQNFVLGVCEGQMNKQHDYGGVVDHQFRVLEHLGMLRLPTDFNGPERLQQELLAAGKTEREIPALVAAAKATRLQRTPPKTSSFFAHAPEHYQQMVDPYDAAQPLLARAKSYLHANCSSCHVEAGGGNSQIELGFATPLDKMKLVGVSPVHHKLGIEDALLVAPGHPERSILLARLARRGTSQMPQLGTALVDEQAVQLFEAWIKQLKSP